MAVRRTAPIRGPVRLRDAAAFATPFIVAGIVSFLAFFPGHPTGDTDDTYLQAQGVHPVENWHPTANVAIYRIVFAVWDHPAAVLALQCALMWGGLAGVALAAQRRWSRPVARYFVPIGFLPIVFNYLGALMKDTLSAGFTVDRRGPAAARAHDDEEPGLVPRRLRTLPLAGLPREDLDPADRRRVALLRRGARHRPLAPTSGGVRRARPCRTGGTRRVAADGRRRARRQGSPPPARPRAVRPGWDLALQRDQRARPIHRPVGPPGRPDQRTLLRPGHVGPDGVGGGLLVRQPELVEGVGDRRVAAAVAGRDPRPPVRLPPAPPQPHDDVRPATGDQPVLLRRGPRATRLGGQSEHRDGRLRGRDLAHVDVAARPADRVGSGQRRTPRRTAPAAAPGPGRAVRPRARGGDDRQPALLRRVGGDRGVLGVPVLLHRDPDVLDHRLDPPRGSRRPSPSERRRACPLS